MKMERKPYGTNQDTGAKTRMVLRVLVSAYLLYLACQLLSLSRSDSAIPAVVCWIVGGIFAAAAVAFGIYSWKQYQTSQKDSKCSEDDEQEPDL